ncbi:MAG TPA: cyclic nucleotide-binding domain-containing protein [Candidatus Binatia bacterium]|nr:cyclic nucleotide-binding domain-containing protein [Candidatus Binatia bacterium]
MPKLDLFGHFENPVHFKEGDVLLTEGAPGREMYALQEGTVEIRAGETLLSTLGPGDFFGEMALIDEHNRSGSVVASSDGKMVPITKERFMFLVQHHPFFSLEVMRVLVERLRAMNRLAAQAKSA